MMNKSESDELKTLTKDFSLMTQVNTKHKESRDFIYRAGSALLSRDDEANTTKIKNFPLLEMSKFPNKDRRSASIQLMKLPIRHPLFCEYAMELTREEFVYLFGKIRATIPLKDAILLSDQFLAEMTSAPVATAPSFALAHHMYHLSFPLLDGTGYLQPIFTAHERIMSGYKKIHGISLLVGALEVGYVRDFGHLEELIEFFVMQKSAKAWVSHTKDAERVIQLLMREADAPTVIDTIYEVMELGTPLTLMQWTGIVARFGEFTTAPVSWWKDML